jgi:hypothetical protein
MPVVFLQRRWHGRIVEPRMPRHIRPQPLVHVPLRRVDARPITLLRRLTISRRRCVNNNRTRMRTSRHAQPQWKGQCNQCRTQKLLHRVSLSWILPNTHSRPKSRHEVARPTHITNSTARHAPQYVSSISMLSINFAAGVPETPPFFSSNAQIEKSLFTRP